MSLTVKIGDVLHAIVDVITNRDGSVAEHAVLPLQVTSIADDGTVAGHILPNGPGESTFVSGVKVHDSIDDALFAYTSPDHASSQVNRHASLPVAPPAPVEPATVDDLPAASDSIPSDSIGAHAETVSA